MYLYCLPGGGGGGGGGGGADGCGKRGVDLDLVVITPPPPGFFVVGDGPKNRTHVFTFNVTTFKLLIICILTL